MTRVLAAWSGVALVVFVALAALVVAAPPWLVEADEQVSQRMVASAAAGSATQAVAEAVTWLGSGWVGLVVVGCVGGALLLGHRVVLALWVALTVGASALLNTVVKALVARDRPSYPEVGLEPLGSSFPSGHSQGVVVIWVSVVLVVGWATVLRTRRAHVLSAVCVVLVIGLVGWSRVALGVHWPTDVLGGWSLGSGWVLGAAAVLVGVGRPRPRSRLPD